MSHVGVSGAWKAWLSGSGGAGTAVGVSGAWKSIQGGWIGAGGAWKQFFTAATVTVSGETIVADTPEEISVRFNSDGTVDGNFGATGGGYIQIDSATDWVVPNSSAPDDYEIMATLDSGSIDTGSSDALNTWLPLTVNREWFSNSVGTTRLTIGIRKGSSGSAIDSAVYILQIPPP